MKSFIPWVGGKGKLLWILNKLAPERYNRFIDVFGGSGTVTMSRPLHLGCMEVYNDFNGNLTNLFCCVKNRPMALLRELGFLPLNTRDDFNVLYKFFSRDEFTDDYLREEMELTEILLKPPDAEAIRALMLERAPRGDIRRAADYFKMIRYSFSGSAKSFGGKPCDIRRFFHLIWECSRRLANVVIENKDFEDLIRQYDRCDAYIYCDPPYFEAECYEVGFPKENHQRLHDVLLNCQGYVMVSYNYCDYISELYKEFYIFRTVRPNSMSQKARSEYEEAIITNYDPRRATWQLSLENLLGYGFASITSPIMLVLCIILMAYAVIKVFFANLKRGGILLIQIAVGSLYMFSVPRGYTDGFVQWCKQIIGLCLTAFLQSTILIAGLMVFKDSALLGLGLMLSAGEIPRIAGTFGLDTTTRANIMSAVYTAQAAVNTTKTVVQAVSK